MITQRRFERNDTPRIENTMVRSPVAAATEQAGTPENPCLRGGLRSGIELDAKPARRRLFWLRVQRSIQTPDDGA
jgi:hypothetical protein